MARAPTYALLALLTAVLCASVQGEPDPFVLVTETGEIARLDINESFPFPLGFSESGDIHGNCYVPPRGSPVVVADTNAQDIRLYNDTDCLEPNNNMVPLVPFTIDEIACTFASCFGRCAPPTVSKFAFSPDRGGSWREETWPAVAPPGANVAYKTVECSSTACVAAGELGAVVVFTEGVGFTPPVRMDDGTNFTFTASAVWENGTETVFYLAGENGLLVKFDPANPNVYETLTPPTLTLMHAIHVFPHSAGLLGRALIVGGLGGELYYSLDESASFMPVIATQSGFVSGWVIRQLHCQADMYMCVVVGHQLSPSMAAVHIFGTRFGSGYYVASGALGGAVVGLRSLSTCGNGVLEGNERCEVGDGVELLGPPPGNYTGQCPPPPSEPVYGPLFPLNDPNVAQVPHCPLYDTACYYCTPGCKGKVAGPVYTCGDGVLNATYEECDNGAANNDTLPDACRTNCVNAGCGDGIVDSGEICDDGIGNSDVTPGACLTTCKYAVCGDGVVDPDETCDDGAANNDTVFGCRTDCRYPSCGNEIKEAGEECDWGLDNSNTLPNACRYDCKLPHCGDYITDFGEDCDWGAGNSDTFSDSCRSDCTWYRCGDGVLDSGEVCDDATPASTPASTPINCTWHCQLPNCGDGVLDLYEDCDNGTANNDTTPDACRTNCRNPRCGDGVVDTGEACDGPLAGPGVVNGCKIDCTLPYCGDGVIQGDEQCDGSPTSDCVTGGCVLSDCGNGVVDVGEACDDGINNNSYTEPNACRRNCQLPYCGDDVVDDELGEECDSAYRSDLDPDTCRLDCTLPRCGDGAKDTGEDCDWGGANSDSPDDCRLNCRYPACGDGIVDSGEECDEGHSLGGGGGGSNPPGGGGNSNVLPNACRKTCLRAHCGDGVVDDGEDCDGGDCCTASCTFVSPGVVCRPVAGGCDVAEKCTGWSATCPTDAFKPSGVVCRTAAAQCEVKTYCSGNSTNCSGIAYKPAGALCDDGDSCTGPYDTCNGTGGGCVGGASDMCGCGDGVLDTLEECDDGNTANGDGCADDCTIESGYYCTSAGVCSPNNNCPDSSLTRDCYGDCGGTATIDDCAVCAGGNTSRVPDANKDGCGVCFGGGAHKDSCGVCFGGDAAVDACGVCHGDNSSCAGCDGVPNSGLVVDVCGDCGGNGTSCLGCDGLPIPEGGAHYDACWVCGGDSTSCHTPCMGNFTSGVPPELFDCNGTCGGTAFTDDCGVCVGGATGLPPNLHPLNCDNTTMCPLGKAVDVCGVCGGDGTSCRGCDGVPFSSLVIDVCGVCGGDGSSCEVGCDGVANSGVVTDCSGVCGGSAAVDSCGMCTGGTTGKATDGHKDSCGECFGGNRDRDSCGVCGGGDASRDDCGVCSGLNAAMDVCGVCYGASEVDVCGECNGNLTCLGCDNVPFSGVDYDDCGVCGGGCTSAVATGDSGKVKEVDEKTAAVAISTVLVSTGLVIMLLVIAALVFLRVRRRQAVHAFTEQLAEDTLNAAPTGYIAMVFTDVENSTQLWETYPAEMEVALDSHNEVIRSVMARTRGYEVKTEGDAFMIVFQDAADAVDFCCEAQLELLHMDIPAVMESHPSCKTEAWGRGTHRPLHDKLTASSSGLLANASDSGASDDGIGGNTFLWRGLRVRMGIHCGDVLSEMSTRTHRADYYGPNVNMAARVACTGYGGQVVISDEALKQVRKHVSNSDRLEVETLGEVELKGIAAPVPIHQILPSELAGREFGKVLTGDAVVGGNAMALASRRRASRSVSISSDWDLEAAGDDDDAHNDSHARILDGIVDPSESV